MKNPNFWNPSNTTKFVIVLFILSATSGINAFFSRPEVALSRKSLNEFPRFLGDWKVVAEHEIGEGSMKVLQVDDYIMREYGNSRGEVIGLYIGYFKSQREGKGIHSPRQCLPGAGWQPLSVSTYQMPIPGHNPGTITVNIFVMGKGLSQQLYLFWYYGRGRGYANEYWNKIYLIWDGFLKRRTDGALVRINMGIKNNSEETLKKGMSFVTLFSPILKEYIPE